MPLPRFEKLDPERQDAILAAAEREFAAHGYASASFNAIIKAAGTIVWNGPVGVFEIEQFSHGTQTVAKAVAESKGFSIAGGGDTLAAIEKYGIEEQVSYTSTGGGAFLEFLEGKKLPAVAMLESRAK